MRQLGPSIAQYEMNECDLKEAESMARKLGFTQTAYTSTSSLWGLYCLPDRPRQKHGVIVLTDLGLVFMATKEDCLIHS